MLTICQVRPNKNLSGPHSEDWEREREREGGKERIITRVASDEYFTIFTFCLQSGTERGDHKWVSTDWVDVMGLLLCIQNCLTSPREPRQSKTRNCLKLGSTWTMYNRNWVLKKCQGIVLAFMTLWQREAVGRQSVFLIMPNASKP